MTVLEAAKIVTIGGSVQTLHEDTDLQSQNDPQFKTKADCAPPSKMILLMNNDKQYANSLGYTFWMHNRKIEQVVSDGVLCATIDGKYVFNSLMKPCKSDTLEQLSHSFYGTGGHFRQSR